MNILIKEMQRKFVHLSSLIYPLLYLFFFTKEQMIFIFGMLFFVIYSWDLLRIKKNYKVKIFTLFHRFMRTDEISNKKFTGATFFLLACFLVVLIFPKTVAILSIIILVVCDTCAAIVGMSMGKHKLLDKSWEGFIAFIVSGLIVVVLYFFATQEPLASYDIYYYALAGVFFSAIAELVAKKIKIDDNLIIPIVFAIILNLGY